MTVSKPGKKRQPARSKTRKAKAAAPAARPRKLATPERTESLPQRATRAAAIVRTLRMTYPQATCALRHGSAWELLIATILSAQCTDDRVNQVTPGLFKRYPTVRRFAEADPAEVEAIIKSTGFFRNKTKNLLGAAQMLAERFGGQVPSTMDELLQLPGVARKTANVILGTWFGHNEGVVVDTHVGRLSHRLKLTWRSKDEKDAVHIEEDLMELVSRQDWTFAAHALIWHGRKVCQARRPACERCGLADLCPSAFSFPPSRK